MSREANPTTVQDTYKAPAITGRLPAPSEYRGLLPHQKDIALEYEAAPSRPIEGSSELLRKLSPFVIQFEPPIIFGTDPTMSFQQGKKGGLAANGIFNTALSSGRGMANARASLSNASFIDANYYQNSGRESVPVNNSKSSGGNRNRNADGAIAVDSAGRTEGKTGEPAIADLVTALDIATQLKSLLNAPPLILMVNPQSMSIAYSKIQSYQDRSRYGYIFQAWGEEQPTMTINGRCGAFITEGKGVQYASKHDSAAWQNFMNLFHFYRSNAYIMDTVNRSHAHHFVGLLSIRYDQWVYYGHMTGFNYSYEEAAQHGGISFDIQFTISAMEDTAPQVLNVQPQMSPTPNPNSANLSTNFRGLNEITAVGSSAANSDLADSIFSRFGRKLSNSPPPGAPVKSGAPTGPPSLPPNDKGFQVSTPSKKSVPQAASLGFIDPFAPQG